MSINPYLREAIAIWINLFLGSVVMAICGLVALKMNLSYDESLRVGLFFGVLSLLIGYYIGWRKKWILFKFPDDQPH